MIDKRTECFLYVSNMNSWSPAYQFNLLHIILLSKYFLIFPNTFYIEQFCGYTNKFSDDIFIASSIYEHLFPLKMFNSKGISHIEMLLCRSNSVAEEKEYL